MGKVFERMVNNRIKDKIRMPEYQAGGQAGRSTVDHINSIIHHNKKKNLYIVFLDVTKAYDKAITDPKNPWRKRVENTMRESKIDEESI